jgi:hypothetical protein
MRAAKRRLRALQPGEEVTLYDEENEVVEDEELEASKDDEETHTNGHTPEEPAFLDTADEDELRAVISNLDDVVEVLLPIPEWKVRDKDGKTRIVQVLIRSLTTFERTQFIKAMNKNGVDNIDMTKMYADLVILSTRHPKTKRLLFKNADRGMLNTKMGAATERIAMRATDISGLSQEFLDGLKKK